MMRCCRLLFATMFLVGLFCLAASAESNNANAAKAPVKPESSCAVSHGGSCSELGKCPVKTESFNVMLNKAPAKLDFSINHDFGTMAYKVSCTVCTSCQLRDICLIVSRGDEKYSYFFSRDTEVTFPFNMGDGKYKLIVGNVQEGGVAVVLWTRELDMKLKDPLAPFLHPSQIVDWNEKMDLVTAAKSLKSEKSTKDTAAAIVKYIRENYKYNNPGVLPGYIPNLISVFNLKSGICYDFAALYCAMSRSLGIPTKLLMGYSEYIGKSQYHAWCQVFVDGEWLTVDPTYRSKNAPIFLDEKKTVVTRRY